MTWGISSKLKIGALADEVALMKKKATEFGNATRHVQIAEFAQGQNAAHVVESDATRRAIRIYSRRGAPVIAVNDGRISRIGHSRRLGSVVELQDSYGNTYTYAGLGRVAKTYPFPKQRKAKRRELALPPSRCRPRCPPRSACSRIPTARTRGWPAATSSSPCRRPVR